MQHLQTDTKTKMNDIFRQAVAFMSMRDLYSSDLALFIGLVLFFDVSFVDVEEYFLVDKALEWDVRTVL